MKYSKIGFDPLLGGGNEVLEAKGFYISYNPSPGESSFGSLMETFVTMFAGEEMDRSAETALVKKIGDKRKFYILNGDFRKEYAKLAPRGWKACYAFYLSKRLLQSTWSDDYELGSRDKKVKRILAA